MNTDRIIQELDAERDRLESAIAALEHGKHGRPRKRHMPWLSANKKLLLASVAIATVIGPVTFGILNARAVLVQIPSPEGSTPTSSFEVASVRLDRSGQGSNSHITSDRFVIERWSAKELIEYSYELNGAQVLGGPHWIDSERYNIEAKLEDADVAKEHNMPSEQRMALMRLRVRDLLADRFGLRLRHSVKELPILALVVARNGPKFSAAKPLPSPAPDTDGRRAYMTTEGKQWVLSLNNVPLSYLVRMLSGQPEVAGRVLVDKTALTGPYDLKLQWEPQNLTSTPNTGSERSGATLFTALQEQLGLKVESRKEPLDVVVIDRIDKPSEN